MRDGRMTDHHPQRFGARQPNRSPWPNLGDGWIRSRALAVCAERPVRAALSTPTCNVDVRLGDR
jgi:hypothetical protein